ncbi:AbiV family abortive infection protein [Psychroserpens luteus]|uniref:AbiV family abortive infection protein n=1 Tax=Psychroserpens luteus TaxID=1434066 RepID=A0ABW5ZPD8_9FLAO|nr:AbiV family abortive infection protein [Psychroserpens luteus]
MIRTFPHLKAKESIGLDVPIYRNAIQLKKDALLIAQSRKSYSSATSLLILSTEEVIKSILVRLHAEGYKIYKAKEVHKFFRDHKIRHQIAQLMEMGVGLSEALIKYDEQKPTTFAKTRVNWFNKFINVSLDIIKALEPLLHTINKTVKLQGFDNLKNKGLYVDFQDVILSPQIEITEHIYNETLVIANRVFMFSKVLRILHHPKLENHMDAKELKRIKAVLKKLVDDHIDEISFKKMNEKMKGL